jgi:hypothetical protein
LALLFLGLLSLTWGSLARAATSPAATLYVTGNVTSSESMAGQTITVLLLQQVGARKSLAADTQLAQATVDGTRFLLRYQTAQTYSALYVAAFFGANRATATKGGFSADQTLNSSVPPALNDLGPITLNITGLPANSSADLGWALYE